MYEKLPLSKSVAVGVMLFALFFGAGNLIFPAQLGQEAGSAVGLALIGLLITGVGLPLLGILAMGFSGSRNLQDLASRIHPVYGLIFTCLLYLTIGPFFASPRTATVAYEVGIVPLFGNETSTLGLFLFTIIFFIIVLFFSFNPAKIVDHVGKLLAPGIVIVIGVLVTLVIVNPIGEIQAPYGEYATQPFVKGFLVGYNTMDALASLVFGIIVINAIKGFGVQTKIGVMRATVKTGLVATFLLAIIYTGVAYMGVRIAEGLEISGNGGQVLSGTASHYFGKFGLVLLAVLLILACLTTAIGLTIACAEYFQTLMPKISYRAFVIFFVIITFIFANFGLTNIITYSIPVLMFLYPLAIVLMLLTFLSPFFNHRRFVYVLATFVTFLISIVDGLKELVKTLDIATFTWLKPVINFYEAYLPLYNEGLGWLVPFAIVTFITGLIARIIES